MTEQLQAALAALLAQSTTYLQDGVTYAQAQLPDVVQQLLTWHLIKYSVMAGLAVGALLSVFIVLRIAIKFVRRASREYDEWRRAVRAADDARIAARIRRSSAVGEAEVQQTHTALNELELKLADLRDDAHISEGEAVRYVAIPSIVVAFALLVLSATLFNLKWLQILVAPKVYLVEYAASLLK